MAGWVPPDATTWAAKQARTTASGCQGSRNAMDSAWHAWEKTMAQYRVTDNSEGLPRINFWLVLALPGNDYSDSVVWHGEIPMLVPTSGTGTLTGIARTRDELDKLIAEDPQNIHLTYKVKIQGGQAWRELLEFLAKHGYLEKD